MLSLEDTTRVCTRFQRKTRKITAMLSLFLVVFSLILWPFAETGSSQPPVVKTTLGYIQGKVITAKIINAERKDVREFLGIPYAQPPLGNLRFRKPEPVQPWSGTYQATKWSDICVQSTKMWDLLNIPKGGKPSEDCLYLNVWTPIAAAADKPKAVMVFIHGGAYRSGAASQPQYNGAVMSSLGDVVVVTVNYRVGTLGFLNLGLEDAPGNQGLWDQRLALPWVRDHISNFGGDPNLITIFGESSGSRSVGSHILSPMSRGLFRRAIMQSGAPISSGPQKTPEEAFEWAIAFAEQQGCFDQDESKYDDISLADIVSCLRQINMTSIIDSEDEYNTDFTVFKFVPTYGDEFMPHTNIDQTDARTPIDLLIGLVANEGSFFIQGPLMKIANENKERKSFSLAQAKQIAIDHIKSAKQATIDQAISFYFGRMSNSDSSDSLKQQTAYVIGDFALVCSAVYFAEQVSTENQVYFYQFNHRTTSNPSEEWTGVNHGEDLWYIFVVAAFQDSVFTEEETKFALQLADTWTTFAKTGKPRVPGIETWPRFSAGHPVYVDLKPRNYTTGIGPRLESCNFWRCHL